MGTTEGQTDKPAIRVSNLTKRYQTSDGEITALDDISLTIDSGTVVGVLGPNGAGKTTLIKLILDLVYPTSGTVEIFGRDVHETGRDMYLMVSAMLEGARNVYWRLSLRENMYYFTSLQGIDPASVAEENRQIAASVGLEDRLDEPINSFSRGMKQKAALACTLVRRTNLLFLDEPTLGLDVEASMDLRRRLRQMADEDDKTVVLSSHDMDTIEELCDRVIVLNRGTIVADDSVESLLDAFRTQSYRIRVDPPIPTESRRAIAAQCASTSWNTIGDSLRLEVTLEDPSEYYDVLGALEKADATIRGTETIDPDLEEIFLRVTEETEETDAQQRNPRVEDRL